MKSNTSSYNFSYIKKTPPKANFIHRFITKKKALIFLKHESEDNMNMEKKTFKICL